MPAVPRRSFVVSVLGACAVLGGCALLRPPPAVPPATSPAPAQETEATLAETAARAERLHTLLDAAEWALAEDRLTTPAEDSAYLYFSEAQKLAPEDAAVREGFERIVERYLALAKRAIEREAWARARSMLDRAALVDSAHSGIAMLRRQAHLLANAERLTLDLDRDGVRRRLQASADRLAAFGAPARRANARVRIRAGSDAEGRWIYRQLGNAPGERRIRAGIEIGLPPQVTILLLPARAGGESEG